MIGKRFNQSVHAIFRKSVVVCPCIVASGYLVSIIPEFQCNQYYSDVYFTVNLIEFM